MSDIASDQLQVLAIDSISGALTHVPPSPYTTIGEPVSAVVTPSGAQVYVVGMYGNQVGAYNLSLTGALTPVAGEPFSTGATGSNAHTVGIGILTS